MHVASLIETQNSKYRNMCHYYFQYNQNTKWKQSSTFLLNFFPTNISEEAGMPL